MKKYIFTIIGIVLLVISLIFSNGNLRNLLVVSCLIFSLLPIVIANSILIKKESEKEEKFLEFIRDILEGVKSGTPITKTIINIQGRDYGVLSNAIKKLANQIVLGLPLNEALENFSIENKNELISKTVNLLSEVNRSGGNIVDVLSSIAESINQTQLIKKERKSSVVNLQVQGYVIFIVFMIIVLVLEFFLMPKLTEITKNEEKTLELSLVQNINFTNLILSVIVVESIFSGLVIGKIAEGSIKNGIKHSFILSSFSLFSFFLAKVIF